MMQQDASQSRRPSTKSTYFRTLTELLKGCRSLDSSHELEFKNVFGAVAGYVDGQIFISCGSFGVAPPATLGRLFEEKGVKHLRYFPQGHIKKEYGVLSRQILNDPRRLSSLIGQSVKFAMVGRRAQGRSQKVLDEVEKRNR